MAVLHPFKAYKPSKNEVRQVACVPYDVISTEEARKMAQGNDKSFLHIIRPEIDLSAGTAYNEDAVYEKGAENLRNFIDKGILTEDEHQTVYIYRLGWKGKTQTGIFGCVSVDDYDREVILKHELTRPAKENDRTRHILTQSAHAEPVMMTFKDSQKLEERVRRITSEESPLFEFTAEDGVQHTLWKAGKPETIVDEFKDIEKLYIADGHHRCKSAHRAAEELRKENEEHTGDEEYNYFPAVLFPLSEMNILPYNRIVHSVPENFEQKLEEQYEVWEQASPSPTEKGTVSVYIDERWKGLKLPIAENPTSVEQLDVHRLQSHILEPLLHIKDTRTDDNISFVGGIRGTDELEERVDSGKAEVAFSMYPTAIEELVEVSDEGLLMPPKSTWFEPKLRSGLLVHHF